MLTKNDRMRIVNRVYRHKIEIWDLDHTEENELHEEVQKPKKVCELWADVSPIRGKEYLEVQKVVSEIQYRITTRYRQGIHQSMLVKWRDKELNINSVINISGADEYMELMCTERAQLSKIDTILTKNIKVILGYPASGKTTYVENILTEHDLVIDLDKLVAAMTMKPIHDRENNSSYAVSVVNDLIDDFIDNLQTNSYQYRTVYIIRTKLSDEQYLKLKNLGAKFYWIDTDINTCIERLKKQGREDVIPYLDSCTTFKEQYEDVLFYLEGTDNA